MPSEQGSDKGSEHTDWAFVEESHTPGASTLSPEGSLAASPEASLHEDHPQAMTSVQQESGQPKDHENAAAQQGSGAATPTGANSSRKRIVVLPRRSTSLSQSQKNSRRLFSAEADAVEGDWHATKYYEEDIRRASSAFPKPKAPAHTHRHLKLLLVGEGCVGKTTLVKNLFAAYCRDGDPAIQDGPRTVEQFDAGPEESCTDIEVQVQQEDSDTVTSFHYSVQDTPAVNLEGAAEAIIYYIEAQNHQYLANEDDPARRQPVSSFADCRVDACLYLLPPHSLKPSDIRLMASLSKMVPVIPLLAKADAMTTTELDAFRRQVHQLLAGAEEELGNPIMYTFSGAAAEAADEFDFKGFPLATIASRTMDESIGRFWPVRTYPWGKCEAMSSVQSDISLLKCLLFESAYEDLRALTESRYYSYRDNAYATAAAARQVGLDTGAGANPKEEGVIPVVAQQPRHRFSWLKCAQWKVCAAVFVFALAIGMDNLLLRREIGRQRGLHSMKDSVIDSLSDSLTVCERRANRFDPVYSRHTCQHRR